MHFSCRDSLYTRRLTALKSLVMYALATLTQVAEFEALQSVYSEAGAVEEDCEGLLRQAQQVHYLQPNPLLYLSPYIFILIRNAVQV